MQGSNGLQPPINAIKIEAPSYYCNSYTPPAPDHSSAMLQAGAYSTPSHPFTFRSIGLTSLFALRQVRCHCTATRRARSTRAGTSASGG